ncbi:MAG: hypothetical protein ACP5I8_04080 [Phycisphaerae bacterium]
MAAPVAKPLAGAYEQVLSAMRRPTANGLLITSVELPADLTRIGLRPADIVTRIAGRKVGNTATLKAALPPQLSATRPIALLAVRGLTMRHFLVPAKILGDLERLGMISVRAGAPAKLNPPATARRKLELDWSHVQTLEPRGHEAVGDDTWMLVFYHRLVVGAIHLQVSHLGPSWKLLWNQESVSGGPLPALAWRIGFNPGDYHHQPAIRMATFTRWSPAGVIQGRRAGETFHVTSAIREHNKTSTRLYPSAANAVPLPLLALLACTMPKHRQRVLPITDLAQQTLETRLGCVLVSGGGRKIIFAGANQPGRVVLGLWMDIPLYQFWLSPAGTLLGLTFGPGFSAYRVGGASVIRKIIPQRRRVDVLPANVTLKESSGD